MVRSWKQVGMVLLAGAISLVMVSDVQAWPFRRRRAFNNGYNAAVYNNGPAYRTYSYGAYGPAVNTGVGVAAPGVSVDVAPGGGVNVAAPGVDVNTGPIRTAAGAAIRGGAAAVRGGANIVAPGANVGVGPGGANANLPGPNVDGDARIRGQSPDGNFDRDAGPPRRGDNNAPPPAPRGPAPAPGAPGDFPAL
jgi:hypothetical protein